MASVVSLEKIEIIRSQEFMLSKARLKFLKKKKIILGPETAILGPQFCRILVLGPHFWWLGAPLDPPLAFSPCHFAFVVQQVHFQNKKFKTCLYFNTAFNI